MLSFGEAAFYNCISLTSVTIPGSVTAIGRYAFNGCTSLASVTIPDSVTIVDDSAFEYCVSLTSVTFGSGVTTIGWYAFNGCASLASVTIPDSVTTIGDYAFSNCESLTSVYFVGNAPEPGSEVFSNTPVTVYYLPGTTGRGATYAGRATQLASGSVPAPSGLWASVGKYTDRITLSWQPAAGATHYRVYRASSATGEKTALGGWQTHSWHADYSAPYVSTMYYFVQAARDANGTGASGYSAARSGYRRLAPPGGIWASDGKYTDRVTVSWKPVAGANYYRVWRAVSPTGAKLSLGGWRRETFYKNYNPVPGRTYYYFIQAARDATGWHPSSISGYNTGWRWHGMVLIPGGTNSGTDPDFGGYSLTVSSFYMDATEVTKAKWDEVYTWAIAHGYNFDNAGSGKAANHPVHTVNWYDVVKWCNARSQKEGRTPCYNSSDWSCNFAANGYRLPTNTEWEYAARGGLSGRRFPWGDTIQHSRANYYSTNYYSYDTSPTSGYHPTYATGGYPYTSPARAFAANAYGLYDMAGNVWEWCNDPWGSGRAIRGGGWFYNASYARCDRSYWGDPDGAGIRLGFRAVCR